MLYSLERMAKNHAVCEQGNHHVSRSGYGRLRTWLVVIGSIIAFGVWLHAVNAPASAAVSPVVYTIHNGDSVWTIAERFSNGQDPRPLAQSIIRDNHLDASNPVLMAGQELRIQPTFR